METVLCSYAVGVVVTLFVFMIRHHLPWGGMPPQYGLPFLFGYALRNTAPMLIWPVSFVVWATRGFPPSPYDLRLLPDEARAAGKRA